VGLICVTSKLYSQRLDEVVANKVKSIALISTIIGPTAIQDYSPIAGVFNKKSKSISSKIIDEEKNNIEEFREQVAAGLKRRFSCNVYYGQSLSTKPEYIEITKKYNFPDKLNDLIIPTDEINPFPYGSNTAWYLQKKSKSITSEICRTLGTDLIAVSYSSFFLPSQTPGDTKASLCLYSLLFFYNTNGFIAFGEGYSDKIKMSGDDIEDYKNLLKTMPSILDPLINEAIKKINKKYGSIR